MSAGWQDIDLCVSFKAQLNCSEAHVSKPSLATIAAVLFPPLSVSMEMGTRTLALSSSRRAMVKLTAVSHAALVPEVLSVQYTVTMREARYG